MAVVVAAGAAVEEAQARPGKVRRRAGARALGIACALSAALLAALVAAEAAHASDRDGDGVHDVLDNCPLAANPGQDDRGGLGGATADDVGDACQCGDVTGDGRVTLADAVAIRRALLVPPTAALARSDLCDVGGTVGCNLADAVTLSRALLAPPSASIARQCEPARLDPGFVTGITGRVYARRTGGDVPLVGATVFVRDDGGVEDPLAVTSDAEGRYPGSSRRPGRYTVCARATGFSEACHPDPVTLSDDAPDGLREDVRDLVLDAKDPVVHGRVVLADGTPCWGAPDAGAPGFAATVSHASGAATTAGANGAFVLSGLRGRGFFDLDVACQSAIERKRVAITDDHLSGRDAVELRLSNQPPRIELLHAEDAQGNGLRRASPGAAVKAVATVVDPDGDPLAFVWRGSGPQDVFPSTAQVDWELLPVSGQNTLRLIVSDGRGGRDSALLELAGGAPGARFVGAVVDAAGVPVTGALVKIGSGSTTTDGDGRFALTVPEAQRHLVRISKRGFGPYTRVHFGGSPALGVVLKAAERFDLDARSGGVARTGNGRARVEIPRGAVVDSQGAGVTGPVSVELHPIDPAAGEAFGDGSVRTLAGGDATLTPVAGLSVELFDAAGAPLAIAPGATARLSFEAPPRPIGTPAPPTLPLLRFDETTGVWEERGVATLAGNRYDADVPGFSAWSLGIYGLARACLRLSVDAVTQERPFHFQMFTTKLVLGMRVPDTKILDQTFADPVNLVNRLAPNTWFALAVGPRDLPGTITNLQIVNSGPNVNPAEQPYPYSACVPVKLKGGVPNTGWLDLLYMSQQEESVQQDETIDYYQEIRAYQTTPNFTIWRAFYGFTPADDANEVVWVNKNELGIGRRGNCKETPVPGGHPIVACYVTKYGHVGAFDAALDDAVHDVDPSDTVAMVWGPPYELVSDRPRVAKFFIFGPGGQLKTRTTFDSKGEVRHASWACEHCHGMSAYVDRGQFIPFDPQAYQFPPSGPFSLASQQERFRQLNVMVSKTYASGSAGKYLLDRIYPFGSLTVPGAVAVKQVPPVDWGALTGGDEAWRDVVSPSCMGCHWSWGGSDNPFRNPDSYIDYQVMCDGWMPRAMAPGLRLWRTVDPFLIHVVQDAIGTSRCGPGGQRPTVTITSPVDGASFSYAGFGGFAASATASDPEDGASCCTIEWEMDGYGILGYGSQLLTSYGLTGQRRIWARAIDSHGQRSVPGDSVIVNFVNDPPVPDVLAPANQAVLTPGVLYGFSGTAFDANEDYFDIPCTGLSWATNVPADGTRTGCNPQWSFATPGTRVVTLTATDSKGGAGTDAIVVNVQSPPAGGPPVVSIAAPGDGQAFQRTSPIFLLGTAVDTDRTTQTVTRRWAVQFGSVPEVTIGSASAFNWTPSAHVPFHCGGRNVKLRLYATDPDGTAMDEITIFLYDPPC